MAAEQDLGVAAEQVYFGNSERFDLQLEAERQQAAVEPVAVELAESVD